MQQVEQEVVRLCQGELDVAADEPLTNVTQQFLDNEFGRADVNHFAALVTAPKHVASLDAVTNLDRPVSERYRDIMRPLGLGDELRAALTVGEECWGFLCLHREDHRLGFTEDEAALAEDLTVLAVTPAGGAAARPPRWRRLAAGAPARGRFGPAPATGWQSMLRG